jgi:signal transduction histidine kinase
MEQAVSLSGISNRILIADDDRTNRFFLKKGVSGMPYEFVFVESGDQALEKILNEDFDLLLLDVVMPGMTGFEVIEEVKKQRPNFKIPFMFLTGQSEADSIAQGFSIGAIDYITKPFTLIEIRLRIKTHHDLYKSQHELKSYAKNMEDLANERAQQLVHSDRLATMGTMSAGIMHEINNPTTFISGNIQLLQTKFLPIIEKILKNSPEASDMKVQFILSELPKLCEGINKGVDRIKKITNGLKAFSRASNHHDDSKKIDLRTTIENALTFLDNSLSKRIEIIYKKPQSPMFIHADSQQLEQIVINLIINSSHALENHSDPQVSLILERENHSIICRISDNGSGIPEDVLKNIWEPFFTTKEKGKGTGLGLSICKEIVQAHSGSLEYTGSSSGAAFTMNLPEDNS